MSTFYDDMAATAIDLLTEFGQSITLNRKSGNSIDPVTGAEVAGSDASVITTGLIKPYPDSVVDGTRIMASDRMVILTNEQAVLSTDKLVISGEYWRIVDIKTVRPDSTTVVVYFVQVRR